MAVRRGEDALSVVRHIELGGFFRYIAIFLVLRGFLAFFTLILGAQSNEPVYFGLFFSSLVYACFVFSGLGMLYGLGWGVVLAELSLLVAFLVDVFQPGPKLFVDFVDLLLVVALSGSAARFFFKD
jgi:hypothetical protein